MSRTQRDIIVEYGACNLCRGCGGYAVSVGWRAAGWSLRVLGGAKSVSFHHEILPGDALYGEALAKLRAMSPEWYPEAAGLADAMETDHA